MTKYDNAKARVQYAKKLVEKYGGVPGRELDEAKIKKMSGYGQIAKHVLNPQQYVQWLLDEGHKWGDDAPGKDEYYAALRAKVGE